MNTHAEVMAQYLGVFVDELVAAGLEHVCLCPGSRSTPLALTFARHPGIKVWTHLDERSCAYFALGMTKSYAPVAILCSSGTAAVNFAPAVVEAYHSHAPLIVLTADRPQELRDLGANQTIDQVRLYGSAVKWFVEMPLPEASDHMLRYARMVARRGYATAGAIPRGPVHLNFPFREPLLPAARQVITPAREQARQAVHAPERGLGEENAREAARNYRRRHPKYLELREQLIDSHRGVIVCGPESWVSSADLGKVARDLGFPVLVDALSGLRSDLHVSDYFLGAYDSFLRSPALLDTLMPDLIIRVGRPPTSKALTNFQLQYAGVRQIFIADTGSWNDPDVTAHDVLQVEPFEVFSLLVGNLEVHRDDSEWIKAWKEAEYSTTRTVKSILESYDEVTEPGAITELAAVVPQLALVVVGNSMPVRDLDSYWPVTAKVNFFFANRGASGIDGVTSTALGTAAVSSEPVVLLIGDLSFYHDMNGLLAAKRFGLKATIVLVNNDGGGIFSFLPQNDDQEHFEQLFGTPHGLDFEPVAKLYGLGWTRVTTREEYRNALKASFESDGVHVIEVKTDRVENLKLHQRIWAEVAKAVEPLATQVAK